MYVEVTRVVELTKKFDEAMKKFRGDAALKVQTHWHKDQGMEECTRLDCFSWGTDVVVRFSDVERLVVKAMSEAMDSASRIGHEAGYNLGYEDGYEDGQED